MKHVRPSAVLLLLSLLLAALLCLTGCRATVDDAKTYTPTESVTSLSLTLHAGDIRIVTGDALRVESNLRSLRVDVRGGTLVIEDNRIAFGDYDDAYLTLTVPQATVFRSVEIETGAGALTIEALAAETLSMELGAGKVTLYELTATAHADIEGGAGELRLLGGSLTNAELSLGAGEITLRCAFLGDSEISFGVGKAELCLLGTAEDYRLHIEKGLGSIAVEGNDIGQHETSVGSGTRRVSLQGGIGAIRVYFEAP